MGVINMFNTEEFKIYVSKYDLEVLQIKRKFYHTFRVEDLCGKIAISLLTIN